MKVTIYNSVVYISITLSNQGRASTAQTPISDAHQSFSDYQTGAYPYLVAIPDSIRFTRVNEPKHAKAIYLLLSHISGHALSCRVHSDRYQM